jgi:two-component system nitrogen regulation response regulator NtrX
MESRNGEQPPLILVVDDEEAFRGMVELTLRDEGFETHSCGDGDSGLQALEERDCDALLLDLALPSDAEGLDVLEQAVERHPEVPVIMISGKGSIRTAMEATRKGAFDFLEKPVEPDRLLLTLRNALERSRLQREIHRLRREAPGVDTLTRSPAMREVFDRALRVAPSDIRVLLLGESGTGKSHLARLLHGHSRRRAARFVSINCSNLGPELAESALFGHERGAFTGAVQRREGRFELAREGTLFLDEVATLPEGVQSKLLRVLQDGEFERVGGTETLTADCRLISATNADPLEQVKAGKLREDLYYRLKGIVLHLPPLRERREDIPLLLELFAGRAAETLRREQPWFSDEALARLMGYGWPGNIRELESTVEATIVLAEGESIGLADVEAALEVTGETSAASEGESASLRGLTRSFQRELIRRRLGELGGHVTRTAESLGISRVTLFRMMKELGIRREDHARRR